MTHHYYNEICKNCKGTGIYVGMAESSGAGVVCSTCKGTGCHQWTYTYEDFEKKKERTDIKRVYQVNPGIKVGEGKNPDGKELSLKDFGGMPYEDWFAGKHFPLGSENRKYTCPAWWYQSSDYEKKPDWKDCIIVGIFSGCHLFIKKEQCWKRWDRENGKNEVGHKRMIRIKEDG
jgi:hypothetical protein